MNRIARKLIGVTVLGTAGLLQAGATMAQDAFPSKPIRLISCCTGFPENTIRGYWGQRK